MATMTIPYAVADFVDLRERGFYYVDKTNYISKLEYYNSPVFLRPRPAGVARAAGIAVLRVFAVDRAREHLRRRGFARAARAAEQIRMRDAPTRDLAAQRFDHSLLPHKILEPRRTIAAIQRLIAHFVASTIQSRI